MLLLDLAVDRQTHPHRQRPEQIGRFDAVVEETLLAQDQIAVVVDRGADQRQTRLVQETRQNRRQILARSLGQGRPQIVGYRVAPRVIFQVLQHAPPHRFLTDPLLEHAENGLTLAIGKAEILEDRR